MADGHLDDQAVDNDLKNFTLLLTTLFIRTIASLMNAKEDFLKKILDQDEFYDFH